MKNVVRILSVLVFLILRLHGEGAVPGEDSSWNTVSAAWPRFLNSSVVLSDGTGERQRDQDFAFSVPPASYAPLRSEPEDRLSSAGARQQLVYFAVEQQVKEGESGKAMIRFKYPEKKAIKFLVPTYPQGLIHVPSTVTMAAGKTRCVFEFSPKNDKLVNLSRDVAVSLAIGEYLIVENRVTVLDDEVAPVLKIRIPSELVEGQTKSLGQFTLDRPADVDFKLSIDGLSPERQVHCPSEVLIRAGKKSADFYLRAIDDSIIEDPLDVSMTAWSNGIRPAGAVTRIIDNESHLLTLALPDSLTERHTAKGTLALGGYLPYDLTVMLKSDGAAYLSFPSQVTIRKGKSSAEFALRVKDRTNSDESHETGIIATAVGFPDVAKTTVAHETVEAGHTVNLSLSTKDLVWDPWQGRIYASVAPSAGEPYGNHVVAIDPTTQQITASVAVGQDPGRLALTSGGEALYVVTNGNEAISKIALPDFTVESSFAVGTHPDYGTLGAQDICTVAGQPDLIVVSRFLKNYYQGNDGVVVYDHGVPRLLKFDGGYAGINYIEPSADPAIFFGYISWGWGAGFRKLQLGADGITALEAHGDLIPSYGLISDIRSDGDTVFAASGPVVDGKKMVKLGTLPPRGLVCPDLAKGSIFSLLLDGNIPGVDKIVAYDAVNYLPLQEFELENEITSPASFIRWGESGLAFRNEGQLILIDNRSLVPAAPPADLAVSVVGNPNPIKLGIPLTYSVNVTNQGQNVARGTVVSAQLSDRQTISSASGGQGEPAISGLFVSGTIGDIAPGEVKTLSIVTSPQSSGPFSCTAVVRSQAVDPVFSDNIAVGKVDVLFPNGVNVVNSLRMEAGDLVYDPTRAVLWATFLYPVDESLKKAVVSIDPLTGIVSDPIPLDGISYSLAVSSNGRYLYVGLLDVSEVQRIDLATAGYPSLRIPLGVNRLGWQNRASDIKVLDGDGTSFMAVCGASAQVYDGTVMRADVTDVYSVSRIQPSNAPGVFIGYTNVRPGSDWVFTMKRLLVTASGVAVESSFAEGIGAPTVDVDGGGLVLSSDGRLMDGSTNTLQFDFGTSGTPCLDISTKRAYFATSSQFLAFDTTTGKAVGSMPLSLDQGEQVTQCIRWGADGFALIGKNDKVYFFRWSAAALAATPVAVQSTVSVAVQSVASSVIQTTVQSVGMRMAAVASVLSAAGTADSDGDGISDGLEYLFGSSPSAFTANPLQQTVVAEQGADIIHVRFPRRAGLVMPAYCYETSDDLIKWVPAQGVEETVISTEEVDGVMIENVDAVIRGLSSKTCSIRLCRTP